MTSQSPQQALHDGFGLLDHGDPKKAEARFRAVLTERPSLIEALYGLEIAKLAQGADHAVGQMLQRVAAEGADAYPPVLGHAGLLLEKNDHVELAAATLRKATKVSPDRYDVLIALARCEMALGFPAAAEANARHALALAPQSIDALFRLARALDHQGHTEEAMTAYAKVLNADKHYHGCAAYLALALFEAGRFTEAATFCRDALVDDPGDAIAHFVLAQCFEKSGRFAEAEQAYLSVPRSMAFNDVRTHIFHGKVSRREDATELTAVVHSFWRHYSETLSRQGWFEQVLEESRVPVAQASEPHRPPIWNSDTGKSLLPGRQITLVSFGTPDFRKAQTRMCRSALTAGEIDRAVLWTPDELSATKYFQDHAALLKLRRGGGCWAWKPYIIYNEMLHGKDGDYVVYYDCGHGEGFSFKKSIKAFVAWCERDDRGFMPGTLIPDAGANKLWTKRDCFHFMGCDSPAYWDPPQVMATFSLWRNSAAARAFVREWMALALDPRLITDHPNVGGLPNHAGFLDHRHDQSILTNLVIRHGMKLPVYQSKDINGLEAVLALGT